ncbi:hypothetical protein C4J81_10230 [Deltaproteobacteria bacterium Smac51]|nr:hypothetical protein C4J81_10230 [Deltaproteobacteria bacterium Smac51]
MGSSAIPNGRIKEIRRWLEDRPEGDLHDLYAEFGGAEMRGTLAALEYLENRREITIAAPEYRYGRKHGNAEKETKQTAIYNTMRNLAKVQRVVCFEEVVRIAEVDESYARRYINFLESLGYVAKRMSGIAVLDKAMKQAKAPRYNQRQERRKAKGAGK